MGIEQKQGKTIRGMYRTIIVISTLIIIIAIIGLYFFNNEESNSNDESYVDISDQNRDKIENGIHLRTGLIANKGLTTVINNCTSCHSAELIIQNRLTRDGWAQTIDWMQETQNLWDLGENEEIIIDYLVTNYPIRKKGRRSVLKNVEWYTLNK
ncbi:monoheme cytochrome C [Costertonia aggregata]|uniref:Monoheme cytochrome C n=1 Tax=Costertonia aggregata TaxID=343403 RepID=A0A7H9AL11_9FLAO|nr:monoheme cytochrome C [Costertonia aggregata]QLG44043.1 monoheme cytochrome C [Costertonia aggregata]